MNSRVCGDGGDGSRAGRGGDGHGGHDDAHDGDVQPSPRRTQPARERPVAVPYARPA